MAPPAEPPPDRACAAFAAHFFATADEAVQDYVRQSLLAAVEDGDSLPDQAEALESFLPPDVSPAQLASGLQELALALRQPQEQQSPPAWLQPPAQQQAASSCSLLEGATGGAADGSSEQALLQAEGAAGEQSPPAGAPGQPAPRSSGLSVAAAEFKPFQPAAAAASGVAAGLQSLQLDGGGKEEAEEEEAWWEEQEEGEDGSAYFGEEPASSRHQWAAAAAAAEAQAAGGPLAAGGAAAEAAFLAVLGEQFPFFSAESLEQLFREQGGDLAATVQTLSSIEAELEGQAQVQHAAAAEAAWGGVESAAPAAPSFTADDFPALGGLSAAAASTSQPAALPAGQQGARAQYASLAAAAASLPAPAPQRRAAGGASGPVPAGNRGAGPAPIWQQEEGVARFATGQALAAEYASLRADARDHARLRNAYFQQATQAYLAGNRRLAKELGAKGRWHNQAMHEAHQAAAAQLFAQRNPGGSNGRGSSAAGRGQQQGGVQTVDLHGLHVREALEQLDSLLDQLGARGGARRLRVVVGEGKHGAVPARLPAAVRRHLEARGVAYAEPYAGMLEVRM